MQRLLSADWWMRKPHPPSWGIRGKPLEHPPNGGSSRTRLARPRTKGEPNMERLHALAARPKRTLGVLVVVLAAVGVAVGSGANFTAQTSNPSNTFSSGTLSMSNSLDGAAILTASNMKPGDTATGIVDIQNTGSISGTFSLSRSALNDSDGANPMSARAQPRCQGLRRLLGRHADLCRRRPERLLRHAGGDDRLERARHATRPTTSTATSSPSRSTARRATSIRATARRRRSSGTPSSKGLTYITSATAHRRR